MRRSLLLALLLTSGACQRGAASSPPTVAATETALAELTVEDVHNRLERHDTIAVFDNNSEARYAQGHVPGARWVRFDQVTAGVLPPDRNTPLVFYCANEH